ncbi:MAG: hypothetical protein WC675_01990 [Patescibacteria group bacterium]|jgi:hypothetical protein
MISLEKGDPTLQEMGIEPDQDESTELPQIPEEKKSESGITPEQLAEAIKKAEGNYGNVYLDTPLGDATPYIISGDQVMVEFVGMPDSRHSFDMKDLRLIDKPNIDDRPKPSASIYPEGEGETDPEDDLYAEQRIIPTDGGLVEGRIVSGLKGGPGVIETDKGKLRVNRLG